MKNQYFGDRRDLFKYDLLLDLVTAHGGGRLAFVPMLTPNDGSGEGQLKQADRRYRRGELFTFLKTCLNTQQRDIRKLRELMPRFGVEFLPFRDDEFFDPASRLEYFNAVPSEHLRDSVVFIDPDIGLETGTHSYMRRRGLEKYLLYSELSAVWSRMQGGALVVYQHLQKDARKRAGDVVRRMNIVSERVGATTLAVQWNDLAFLTSVRHAGTAARIRRALREHADHHGIVLHDTPV